MATWGLGGRIPFVGDDYVTASAAIVDRLTTLGHRRIRYLCEDDDAPSPTDRETGVVRAARRPGLQAGRIVVRASAPDVGDALVEGWRRDGVTAVIVEETDRRRSHAVSWAA
jgi:DNA-binding LacI/PurR family transcriptional regulator